MNRDDATYRPSFYLTINSLFILLVIGVSSVLTWFNYHSTVKIVLQEADRVYDQAAREVSLDFTRTYKPVFSAVELLAQSPVMGAETLDQRLAGMPMLCSVLRNLPELAAIQVGYSDGDYFIVRTLPDERVRTLFSSPPAAEYVVDHIDSYPPDGDRFLARLFFDSGLNEITRLDPVPTEYDPRTRPWFLQAGSSDRPTATPPYLFYFLRDIGMTAGYQPPGSGSVLAADVTMRQLSDTLFRHRLTSHSEIAMLAYEGSVIGYTKPERVVIGQEKEKIRLARLDELASKPLSVLSRENLVRPGPLNFKADGERWLGTVRTLNVSGIEGRDLTLVMVSPTRELLARAIATVKRSLFITLVIIILAIPLASWTAAIVSRALNKLAGEAGLIRRFDFRTPIGLRSHIREVDDLARSMDVMKKTISRFLALISSLAAERNFDAMLEQISEETLKVSGADGVLACLYNEDARTLVPGALVGREQRKMDVTGMDTVPISWLNQLPGQDNGDDFICVQIKKGEEHFGPLTGMFDAQELALRVLPLKTRQDELIGMLCLVNRTAGMHPESSYPEERLAFVRTFSGFAAVSLESRQLLEMQKRLMDSFMHLLAGAIDAKSPYTGGHCQRVPVITKMMARAACEDQGRYREYQLDEEGWEAVHLAGWLHDCGKVTTPEYVVDKATKLETIYDRIHEIRTRFEVLKRDAHIRYYEQLMAGGDQKILQVELEREWQELDNDFAFIAECNVGGEFMAPERIERLEKIAGRTWERTLDDRLGISWEEENRKARQPRVELPVIEHVLSDRQDHLIERGANEQMPVDNPWGFRLDVPEYRYNRGELYNLKIGRGTLTDEERYKINDHIVQTIIMLEKLPYPKHLRNVPELAGGHHETMDGNGYPRRLTGDQMSLTARMMAIADIFEALTASDRPYKKAKRLSEAIRIMSFFKKDHHIDPDLFDLFLKSGVYRRYAEEYLEPDQIDDVDISEYLVSRPEQG